MPVIVPVADLAISPTAARFEGRDHGAPVSMFVTCHPPGARVPLHRHPYAETFLVQEGVAEFTVGDERVEAAAGRIVVVPARTAHGFANAGEGDLRLVSVHPSDHVIQEWLEG
jgi:quercetin dioxygenase-like cupin family protein